MNLVERLLGSGKSFFKRVALVSAITAATLGITACPIIPLPEPTPENKLSENTIILTEEQTAEISYLDENIIIFSEAPDFSPGEILVSDRTPQTPDGLFREVINVVGNTAYTEQANFEDAIENVSFSTERIISDRDSIYVEIPLVDFNSSASVNDSEHDVSAEGNIDIKSDFIFEMEIEDHHLNKLVFKNVIDESSDLSVTAISSLGEIIDEKFHPLPPSYFTPFTLWLPTTPSFPIVITPKLDLIVGLKGGISPLTAQASQSFHSELGVKYENDSWEIIKSMSSDFDTNMQFVNEINFKAYLGPKLDFLIYGGPGPYAQLDGYLELKLDTVNPAVELYGGLEAILGVNMKIFSKTLFDFSTNLLDFNWLIHRWEGPGNHPPELGSSVFLHITEGQQLSYQVNGFDSDGDPITYTLLLPSWYSVNSSTGLVTGTAPQVTENTPYGTFIKGEDGRGGSDLLGFTVTVDDTSNSPLEKILFVSVRGSYKNDANIYLINSDGTSESPRANTSQYENFPSVSRDGSKILYTSKTPFTTGTAEIYVMNADSSGKTRITSNGVEDAYPVFSPNSSKIAYSSSYNGTQDHIYVMNADGSGSTKITTGSGYHNAHPTWSADGNYIAFHSNADGDYEIYKVSSSGGTPQKLTSNPAKDYNPDWSYDGSKIAFSSDRDGNMEIYVISSTGSNLTNISNSSSTDDYNPSWSSNGENIVYVSKPAGSSSESYEVYVMNSDGSSKTKVTNNIYDDNHPVFFPR